MLFSKKIIGSLNRPKTSAAKAEGRLLKSFGIGRLCSASVIVCPLWLKCLKMGAKVETFEIKSPAFSTLNHCVEITSAMFQLSHFYKLLASFESRQMKDCFETLEPINLLISIDRFGETIFNVPALYTK